MALYLIVHNDGSGDVKTGNYDVTVQINNEVLWEGRVENYRRDDGWKTLLNKALAVINARPSLPL